MEFEFREDASSYSAGSQKARVWSEAWVLREMYCPACGHRPLTDFANNQPVADFFCAKCREQFELKSKKGKTFGKKITDGAYATMMERLGSDSVPSLMMLRYDAGEKQVRDLAVIPKPFFTPDIIERRKPLAATARRAGWVGCNILIHKVPKAGRIDLVRDQVARPVDDVLDAWHRTEFLRSKVGTSRGWVLDVLTCVEALGPGEFTLAEVYAFENTLSALHPENNNVRPKIRQQLQVLRDAGLVEFLGRGRYRA